MWTATIPGAGNCDSHLSHRTAGPLGPSFEILRQGQELPCLPCPQNSNLDCIDARSIRLYINKLKTIFAFLYYYPRMLIFYFTFQISVINFPFGTDLIGRSSIDV
ncbi:hypothetical protein BS78_05G146500 [Paspalum vaginatum]|nr:hypothetical protein BS78_05G146500 [Paspalum vaginatum]